MSAQARVTDTPRYFELRLTAQQALLFEVQPSSEFEAAPKAALSLPHWERVRPLVEGEWASSPSAKSRATRPSLGERAAERQVRLGGQKTKLSGARGKELCLLFWALEDGPDTLLDTITRSWVAIAPEERWWLYSTINGTGNNHPDSGHDRGWRAAIKVAFRDEASSAGAGVARVAGPGVPRRRQRAEGAGRPKHAPQTETPMFDTLPARPTRPSARRTSPNPTNGAPAGPPEASQQEPDEPGPAVPQDQDSLF